MRECVTIARNSWRQGHGIAKPHGLRPIARRNAQRRRETENPRGARTPRHWCRPRSTASAFVSEIAHAVPSGFGQVRAAARDL